MRCEWSMIAGNGKEEGGGLPVLGRIFVTGLPAVFVAARELGGQDN
jgi:hypothetical protein